MRFFICVLFLISAAASVFAQTEQTAPARVTRDDMFSAAFNNNPAYQAAIEDRQSARYNYKGSWGAFYPTAELTWTNRNTDSRGFYTSESYAASASMNLFRGFRSYADMRTFRLKFDSATRTERETFLRMVRDVTLAYQLALRADYLRRSSRTLFESAELVLSEAEVRQGLDVISRADLYQARADREKAYSSLIDSEVNYDAAVLELVRITGLYIDNKTVLAPDNRSYVLHGLSDYKNAALANNNTLRQAYITSDIASQSYYSAWGAFMPAVDLSAGTGWYTDESGSYNSNHFGITASWNVFSGLYDTNTMLAMARARNSSRLMVADSRDSLMKEVETAWLKARASHEKVRSAEIYVSAANENYTAVQEMFRLGRVALKDTVDARATLEDAQATLADANYIMVQAYEELALLTGGALAQ